MKMDTRLLDEKNEQDIKEAGKILRRGGDIAHAGDLLKNAVKLQFDCHSCLLSLRLLMELIATIKNIYFTYYPTTIIICAG